MGLSLRMQEAPNGEEGWKSKSEKEIIWLTEVQKGIMQKVLDEKDI